MAPNSYPSNWPPRRTIPLPAFSVSYPWIKQMNAPMPSPAPQPAQLSTVYPYIAAGPSAIPFDMRKNPRKSNRDQFLQHHLYSLFSHPVKQVRLVSQDFPWPIDLKDDWIVCGRVWEVVYAELQKEITPIEWAMATDKQRAKILKAKQHREYKSGNNNLRPLRIDWLGETTMFAGLEKDEAFTGQLTMPGNKENMDTWVIRFTKRP
ncbi:hypothetical protein NM688_g6904 [Phlebia brevispora]|uniref:Uncharacterized protein n=1 Tax=Phlebia brevispora TaxID=194682 RepID=A0ACC1SB34_9APHY|nr:hypothetical protein NM688_g6904 [Phlebia brevispora]